MALAPSWPILGWARTPVAPVGGALAACAVPDLTTPLITHLLQRAGVPAQAVDALILGNALGTGGTVTVTDTTAVAAQRFYRLRVP